MDPVKSIMEQLKGAAESFTDTAKTSGEAIKLLATIQFDHKDTQINSHGRSLWITVYTREDCEKALSLGAGTFWAKEAMEDSILYTKDIDDLPVTVYARGDALPPTCQIVEQDVTIPAQPERIVKKKVVKCNEPAEAVPVDPSVEAAPEDAGIGATVMADDGSIQKVEDETVKEDDHSAMGVTPPPFDLSRREN